MVPREQLCIHKASEEGGGGGVPGTRDSSGACGADHVRQNMQSTEAHGEAEIHLQPIEDPSGCLKEGFDLWEAHLGADLLVGLVTHGGTTLVGPACSLFLKDCTHKKGPTLEQFIKNCNKREELTLGS